MQVDTRTFLRLARAAGTIVSYDTEATGLKGDYNSILMGSFKPIDGKPYTFRTEKPGHDRKVVKEIRDALEKYDCWITYYGRDFDIKLLNTRLLRWGLRPVEKRPHIDMYWQLKSHLLTARRSQAHLLDWLNIEADNALTQERLVKKMSVSAEEWNAILSGSKRAWAIMIRRCESDCIGVEALFNRCEHLIIDIRR